MNGVRELANLDSNVVTSTATVFFEFLLDALGAARAGARWTLKTPLDPDELTSLWLGIAAELYIAGAIPSLCALPAARAGEAIHFWFNDVQVELLATSAPDLRGEVTRPTKIAPLVVLAGFPGSGKTTLANEIRRRFGTNSARTLTNRPPRRNDADFLRGDYVRATDVSIEDRRRADYALPVLAFGHVYHSSVAGKLLSGFDQSVDLVLFIDSHFNRLHWIKKFMPDLLIVWLEAPPAVIERRCAERGDTLRIPTEVYRAGLRATRANANLVLNTAEASTADLADQFCAALSARGYREHD
jgi:predicted kinase